jgi:small subunit ribosomal protein S7|tara:strand:- start:562 stop:1353 length:792 start_codon:yes stop_codon:yes gene_type:complete
MAEKTTKTTKEKPAKVVKAEKVEKPAKVEKLKVEAKPKVEKPKKESKPKKIIAKLNPFQENIKNMKMFGRWTTQDVTVSDPGLKAYMNLDPILVPTSLGRFTAKQFWKSKRPIIERLMIRMFVAGHRGKKHVRTSGHMTGKKINAYNVIIRTFEILEKKTKGNPVQAVVDAIEAAAPREGITTIEYGGVRYPRSVDLSPQKRIDLALRWITQGAYDKMVKSKGKKRIEQTLSEQIIATINYDQQASFAYSKKYDLERQAKAAR